MLNNDFNPSDDRFIRGIIRRKAQQLVGRAGFTRQDREDLERDMLLRVIQSLPRFNPERAHLYKFITTVVERYVANILRNKQAEKRDHRRICSLNVTIEITGEGPTELSQTIGDRELDARIGRRSRSSEELVQLAMDMEELIATLPESWQFLLRQRKSHTMEKISEEMGVPRTTLIGWMSKIRKRFEKAGMEDYLKS